MQLNSFLHVHQPAYTLTYLVMLWILVLFAFPFLWLIWEVLAVTFLLLSANSLVSRGPDIVPHPQRAAERVPLKINLQMSLQK